MFQVNHENTNRSAVFIINFFTPFSSVSIIEFEQVSVSWVHG